jgi:hypothetical protein
MTPAIMEELWEYSPVKGSSLLLLLAIARHANRDGTGAYPSLATLKRLTRLSHSQVCLLLRQLVEEGHLAVTHGGGSGGTNAYTILRTWDTQGNAKIGHAKVAHPKSAHAIAHPKIGHNQEPKEREKISVSKSDVRNSDMPRSDTTGQVITEKAHQWLQTDGSGVDPTHDFYQALAGLPPADAPASQPEPDSPAREKKPRAPALYFQGTLCPRAHDDGTGHTLRRVSNGNCTECDVERTRAKRQAAAAARAQAPKPARQVIDLAAHRQAQGG